MPAQIVRKRRDRRVTLLRALLQRLADDVVQIAAQRPAVRRDVGESWRVRFHDDLD
jgi:hypothetical protein